MIALPFILKSILVWAINCMVSILMQIIRRTVFQMFFQMAEYLPAFGAFVKVQIGHKCQRILLRQSKMIFNDRHRRCSLYPALRRGGKRYSLPPSDPVVEFARQGKILFPQQVHTSSSVITASGSGRTASSLAGLPSGPSKFSPVRQFITALPSRVR